MAAPSTTVDQVVSLAKRRGFVFPCGEIYGGTRSAWDLSLIHIFAMPAGEEDRARAFYGDVLGMTEAPKPAVLAARGGVWFTAGAVALQLGVEAEFLSLIHI